MSTTNYSGLTKSPLISKMKRDFRKLAIHKIGHNCFTETSDTLLESV